MGEVEAAAAQVQRIFRNKRDHSKRQVAALAIERFYLRRRRDASKGTLLGGVAQGVATSHPHTPGSPERLGGAPSSISPEPHHGVVTTTTSPMLLAVRQHSSDNNLLVAPQPIHLATLPEAGPAPLTEQGLPGELVVTQPPHHNSPAAALWVAHERLSGGGGTAVQGGSPISPTVMSSLLDAASMRA